MSTKKIKKLKKPEVEGTRTGTEVRAVVVLEGIRVEDGRLVVGTTLPLPAPMIVENEKWKWTGWQLEYSKKAVEKDLRRLAQTVANYERVRGVVEARAAAKAASKPAPAAVVAAAQQPTIEQAAVGKVPQ